MPAWPACVKFKGNRMKEKLLKIYDGVLGAFTMIMGGIVLTYFIVIATGLWMHLQRYALSAFK